MTAAEIIELIKQLPPQERAEVMAFLESASAGVTETAGNYGTGTKERKVRYISNEKFEEIVPQLFEKHHELFRRLAE